MKNLSRSSHGQVRVRATSKPGKPRGYIACVSRKQRGVIIARKAGSRVQDSFMLKNAMCSSRNEDQKTGEWISEDDTELVRMPAKSISTVKIETYLEAEANLLHLNLRTAIPLQSESSRIDARGSNQDSQADQDEDTLAGPDTEKGKPGKTTKPPEEASSSSKAKDRSQDREASKEIRDAEMPLKTYLPGSVEDCCPPADVEADAQYWRDLFPVCKGARVDNVVASRAASNRIQIPLRDVFAQIRGQQR